jgi:hypothetical protein
VDGVLKMSKHVIHYDSGLIQSTPLNVFKVTLCGQWILTKEVNRVTKNHPEITCKKCYKKWLEAIQE